MLMSRKEAVAWCSPLLADMAGDSIVEEGTKRFAGEDAVDEARSICTSRSDTRRNHAPRHDIGQPHVF